MAVSALKVKNLRKIYSNGKSALAGVDIDVPKGAFYALLGPNGAGKSTLINILADIVRPSSGEAYLMGHDMFRDKAWCKRHLGVVPQEIAFDPFFNPREMLRITSGLFGCKPDNMWIDELLDILELSTHADKNARQLSSGMRQADKYIFQVFLAYTCIRRCAKARHRRLIGLMEIGFIRLSVT